jgi:serine/threonine protein kinase
MEYVAGGELWKWLRSEDKFEESQAKLYAAEIAIGIGALHRQGIVYRNLKPENILVDSSGHIKISGIGPAKDVGVEGSGSAAHPFFCREEYMSPEMLMRRPYTPSIDWWALGVLTYELIVGHPPFQSELQNRLYRMILQEPVKFPRFVSDDPQDFVTRLLDRDPAMRLGAGELDAQEILSHSWFSDLDMHKVARREVDPGWRPASPREEPSDEADYGGTVLLPSRRSVPGAFEMFHFLG